MDNCGKLTICQLRLLYTVDMENYRVIESRLGICEKQQAQVFKKYENLLESNKKLMVHSAQQQNTIDYLESLVNLYQKTCCRTDQLLELAVEKGVVSAKEVSTTPETESL